MARKRFHKGNLLARIKWKMNIGMSNVCIIDPKTVGDWTGHIINSGSDITPNATLQGVQVYETKWNNTTGQFILSFGDSGNVKIENIDKILVSHYMIPGQDIAIWDDTNEYYTYVDLDMAIFLTANLDKTCFRMNFVPELLIDYSFNEILTGEKI